MINKEKLSAIKNIALYPLIFIVGLIFIPIFYVVKKVWALISKVIYLAGMISTLVIVQIMNNDEKKKQKNKGKQS